MSLAANRESTTEAVHSLRSRLRRVAADRRVSQCGLFGLGDPQVVVQDCPGGRAVWWGKVKHCQRQWGCPVCAQRKSADRAAELDRMLAADAEGRWQMLTLTLQHHEGERLGDVFDRLVGAWRSVRSHRAVRDIFSARVSASVRAIEVTWGQNGWHPHVHLMLRTNEWTAAEQSTLERLWCGVAGAELGGIGVRWSTPIFAGSSSRARYLSRLSSEVSGIGKRPHRMHLSPWDVAERAAQCRSNAALDTRWVFLWREYQSSMKGRRALEMDERARAMVPDERTSAVLAERRVAIYGEVYEAIARHSWWFPLAVLEAAKYAGSSIDDAVVAVEITIADLCDGLVPSGVHRARAPPPAGSASVSRVA